ncbi:MAG TPA: 1-acyl-sn-glycerol-3-phosphate acyltransferase [bacterium]|nr:1-acyl-sn-glycerol-3-phosphate acyltransferase [bacterium]
MDDYRDLGLKDFFDGTAREFIKNRILDSDAGLSEDGYDMFGTSLRTITDASTILLFLYKNYFRVEADGFENLPENGPGLIVANHAPILPFDASMIFMAALLEPEKPRFVRTIINKSISTIPFASTLILRGGQVIGCDENVRQVFKNQNLIVVFPTGAEGDVHTIFNKYHLDRFTVGFMEYALKFNTPIIPTVVLGSEEAAMTLGKIDLNFLGFKHLPLTPIFPWLGLAGLIPFPSKFRIHFSEPVDYFTENSEKVGEPVVVRHLVDDLHGRIRTLLDEKLDSQF